jgi:hypothetical protein
MALPVPQIVSVDATQRAFEIKDDLGVPVRNPWPTVEKYLCDKTTGKFLGALAFQEVDYDSLDTSLREVAALVNARMNNPKVLVQPRGSYASRTALRGHVDLDLDLVFPDDFQIEFAGAAPDAAPIVRTISQVLGSQDLFGANPGNGHDPSGNLVITKDGLRLVMIYVWGRLVSDHYRLPNTFTAVPLAVPPAYSIAVDPHLRPAMTIIATKTLATLTRSISAQITDNAKYNPLDVDFFIKVLTKRLGGEEVLVGVDKDGPLGVRQYQTTTFIPSGKEWLGSNPLSPVDRTALLALKWWKNSFAEDPTIAPFTIRDPGAPNGSRAGQNTDIKLKSHHFLSAINALHEVLPTDPLYVPTQSSLPFSLVRVMDVMLKVLTFLQHAYQPAQRFNIVYYHDWDASIPVNNPKAVYPFPQVCVLDCFVPERRLNPRRMVIGIMRRP